MNIERDLRKGGITINEPLDTSTVRSIAKNVSEKISLAFPNYGFNLDDLYSKFSNLPMYIANIPAGLSEASYFYKNSSVYFRDGMGLADLSKYAVHELIHNLQERKDEKGNLVRLGLCSFNGSKICSMALNEAAVQLITSNILESTFDTVTYYDITFSTISPNCYPLLCNLISQIAYVTGEDVLYESTFNSNDHFKNKFSALCGDKTFTRISNNFDTILEKEESIIKLNNILQTHDLKNTKLNNISNKIADLKEQIKTIYFETQELIVTSYFSTMYDSLITTIDLERFRNKLYNFKDFLGSNDNYYFFNNYYIQMMEKLDKKFDVLSDTNTYLIPRKESKFSKIIKYIRRIILKKQFENDEI